VAIERPALVVVGTPGPRLAWEVSSAWTQFLPKRKAAQAPRRHRARNVSQTVIPDLDHWLADPSMRVTYRRRSTAPPDRLWEGARQVRLRDARLLGRLVRWRIPGLDGDLAFDQMFRSPPFMVLAEEPECLLVSGLVGRIWTLRRDYPELRDADEFREWSASGTAKVVFANWIEEEPTELCTEVRVEAIGAQGRMGVAAVRPLVGAFGSLIGSDGLDAAIRRAEQR
jgi:hypothetical protein